MHNIVAKVAAKKSNIHGIIMAIIPPVDKPPPFFGGGMKLEFCLVVSTVVSDNKFRESEEI
jgi:hypothetical protein